MPTITRKTLESALDEIARGDATPADAAVVVRRALSFEPPLVSRVYDALRDVTWRTLTSRSFGDELKDWFEVFRHASALIGEGSAVAEKIRALADLLAQSSRFAEFQPLDEVLGRKHSKSVLSALAGAGKALKKGALKNLLGLADANLSRVTGALQACGLIERSSSGKEASFLLTELGKRAARKLDLVVEAAHFNVGAWWLDVPFPLAVWDTNGNPIGANTAFLDFTRRGEQGSLAPLTEWRLEQAKVARDERKLSRNTWQIKVGDDKWLQFVEQLTSDGKYCILAEDISVNMALIRDLEDRLRIAADAGAKLQQDLADSERRLRAFRSGTSEIREGLVKAAAISNERIRNWITISEHSPTAKMPTQELQEVGRSLDAIQCAVRDVMEPVDIAKSEGSSLSWMDPGTAFQEMVDTANVLSAGAMRCKFDNARNILGAVSPLRTALGLFIFVGAKHGVQFAQAAISGTKFTTTMRTVRSKGNSQETVSSLNLSYCKAVVESIGGALDVQASETGTEDLIKLSFPVDKAATMAGT
ncbi:hypothetical protein [Bradyrhizobium sp. 18]|uniref:hypothetical protein n=1 Tax=Bradyrhizobium sp. 18 TaxID=2782657 RepID=UPI001FFBBD42|nr:hypothetical protein [Bradyrhizobium sp. 18]MCK1504533.1 hypothetical protein [Bradyrhizobium sp. 18]